MEYDKKVNQALSRLLRHVAPPDNLVDCSTRQSQHLIARPRCLEELKAALQKLVGVLTCRRLDLLKSYFKALVGVSLDVALVDDVGVLKGCHQLAKLVLPPLLLLLLVGLFK